MRLRKSNAQRAPSLVLLLHFFMLILYVYPQDSANSTRTATQCCVFATIIFLLSPLLVFPFPPFPPIFLPSSLTSFLDFGNESVLARLRVMLRHYVLPLLPPSRRSHLTLTLYRGVSANHPEWFRASRGIVFPKKWYSPLPLPPLSLPLSPYPPSPPPPLPYSPPPSPALSSLTPLTSTWA